MSIFFHHDMFSLYHFELLKLAVKLWNPLIFDKEIQSCSTCQIYRFFANMLKAATIIESVLFNSYVGWCIWHQWCSTCQIYGLLEYMLKTHTIISSDLLDSYIYRPFFCMYTCLISLLLAILRFILRNSHIYYLWPCII